MGVQGEIDKSSWSKIVVSRKEQRNYVMNLSFLEMATLDEVPRKLNLVHPPKAKAAGDDEKPDKKSAAAAEPRRRRLKSTSVRLNNNDLRAIDGGAPATPDAPPPLALGPALGSVLADVTALRWIDLSFNRIARIGDAFTATPGLNVIYLHANCIASLAQTKPLGDLKDLRSLTLHGNAIEDKKHYRMYVMTVCPTLNQLDFSTITKQDRQHAEAWALTFRRKLHGRADGDDAPAL